MSHAADSAGQPWAGRHFEQSGSGPSRPLSGSSPSRPDDDGSAHAGLIAAITQFRDRKASEADVVDALRGARLLIPLVAHLGEDGLDEHGHDKTQELSIVTVVGPDGRTVLPAFTSVDAMRAWNPLARPVPAEATRVALAAASEQTDVVVLDARSDTEFAVRRPALWAIANGEAWVPSYLDDSVLDAFAECAAGEPAVVSVALAAGDADARLAGPELLVRLALVPGLDREALDALLELLRTRWAAHETIAARVDSMIVRLVKG